MRSDLHGPFVRSCARWLSLALIALIAAGSTACDDGEGASSTQVTARIYFASDVRSALSTLRVRSYRSSGGQYTLRAELSYPKAKLDEVMDVRFTPAGDDLAGTVLVIADALSASGEALVEARATFVFVPGEQRLFELWLYRCADAALGELCAEPSCSDLTCLTCVRGECAATPLYSKPQLTTFDPTLAADPAKPPPGHRPSEEPTDAGSAPTDPGRDASTEAADAASPEEDACAEPCTSADTPDGGEADAALDAGPGVDPLDAGARDAAASDANDPSDARASDASDADVLEPPGRCALEANWTTSRANGAVPAQARVLAQHTNTSGSLPQYLCRMRTPDGVVLTPGKVSSSARSASTFDHGCYGAFYGPRPGRPGSQAWQSFDSEAQDIDFQVLTPASECQLDWVATTAAQGLPARALPVGNTGGASPQPLYACRVNVTDTATSGTHIGRVGGAAGDTCRVQYYQQSPLERTQFEVLVQTRP